MCIIDLEGMDASVPCCLHSTHRMCVRVYLLVCVCVRVCFFVVFTFICFIFKSESRGRGEEGFSKDLITLPPLGKISIALQSTLIIQPYPS